MKRKLALIIATIAALLALGSAAAASAGAAVHSSAWWIDGPSYSGPDKAQAIGPAGIRMGISPDGGIRMY